MKRKPENGRVGAEVTAIEVTSDLAEDSSVEDLRDAFREIDELEKCWNDRLSLNGLRLSKRYLQGKLDIGFTLVRDTDEFLAVVRRNAGVGSRKYRNHTPDGFCNGDRTKAGPYRNDSLVFIKNIQLVDNPEGKVPGWVWFEPVDEPSRFLAGTLYFVVNKGFEFFALSGDRKTCGRVYRAMVEDNGLASDVIKGTSEVMDTITDNRTPFYERFGEIGFEKLAASIRIYLSYDRVRVVMTKGLDSTLKIKDVMFGPFDLPIRAD